VPHHNSVFHSVLKFVPWDKLDDAVERHGARGCARSFSFKSQLIALLYGQLQGAASLRDIETGLSSQADRLYHLGGEPARRSSLAEANHDRPPEVFSDLLAAMLQSATSGLRKAMREATYLIDSTTLRLNALSASWARFSDDAVNAKLHVVFDPDADRPVHAVVSAGKVTDITAAKAMPIVPGVTYVFDLGYYDYTWWAKLDAAKCRIVTRLKANTAFEATQTRPVPAGPILSDRIGLLPQRQARNRRNPMGKPVRQVEVRIQTGKVLRIFTNDLDASAQEIADLYKRRWTIDIDQSWRLSRSKGWVGTSCREVFWLQHHGSIFNPARIHVADRQAIADQQGRVAPARCRGVRQVRYHQDWRANCHANPDIGRGSPSGW